MTAANDFRVEAPPPSKPGGTAPPAVEPALEAIQAHPGEWLRLRDYSARGTATSFASRLHAVTPVPIETTTREIDGRHVVYARTVVES
jgi:hypothetical protein